MSSEIPNTQSSGASTAGATGTGVVLDQALVDAIAAAVQTGVSQAVTQATQQIAKQVAESISGATDSDSGYIIRSSIDPAPARSRLELLAEMALQDCITARKRLDLVAADHCGALPPISAKPTGA